MKRDQWVSDLGFSREEAGARVAGSCGWSVKNADFSGSVCAHAVLRLAWQPPQHMMSKVPCGKIVGRIYRDSAPQAYTGALPDGCNS